MKPIILFAQTNSIYHKLDCDVYDIQRNAFNYTGSLPVICHPPCRLFSRMKYFSNAPGCERLSAFYSITLVRKLGGILEHPESSSLFKIGMLPSPGYSDSYGGFTIRVNQKDFGHKCVKKTNLYIVGCLETELPRSLLNFNATTHTIGTQVKSKKSKFEASKRIASATPELFAKWLIDIWLIIYNNNHDHFWHMAK